MASLCSCQESSEAQMHSEAMHSVPDSGTLGTTTSRKSSARNLASRRLQESGCLRFTQTGTKAAKDIISRCKHTEGHPGILSVSVRAAPQNLVVEAQLQVMGKRARRMGRLHNSGRQTMGVSSVASASGWTDGLRYFSEDLA